MAIKEKIGRFFDEFARSVVFRVVLGFFLLGLFEHLQIIVYTGYEFTSKGIQNMSYGISYDFYFASLAGLIFIILFFLPVILKKILAFVLFWGFSYALYIDMAYFQIFGTHVPYSNTQYFQDIGDFKTSLLQSFSDIGFYLFAFIFPAVFYLYVRKAKETNRFIPRLWNYIRYFLLLLVVGGSLASYANSAFSKNFDDPVVSNAFFYFLESKNEGGIQYFEKPEKEIALVKKQIVSESLQNQSGHLPPDNYPLVRFEEYTHCQKDTVKTATGKSLCNIFGKNNLPNIIFIFLESFRSVDLGLYGGDPSISEKFDELAKEGILFTNFIANGTRTRNGQAAAHCSLMPNYHAVMSIMRTYRNNSYDCLPAVLKRLNYETEFIIASNADFDFQNVFFKKNGFDHIVEENDYPNGAEILGWGYSDEELYNKMLADAKTLKQPFFMSALTITNHHPFSVPKEYQTGATEYADKFLESMRYTSDQVYNFIRKIEKEPWYKNTLVFIFSDTSTPIKSKHHDRHFNRLNAPEKPELKNYPEYVKVEFHIPLLILGGQVPHGIVEDEYAGQIDLPPTVADIIGLRGYTHWAGRSLLVPSKKKWAFFNRIEGNFSLISDQLLMVAEDRHDGQFNYFEYGSENNPELRSEYRETAYAWIKAQQWLLQENKIWNPNQKFPLSLAK